MMPMRDGVRLHAQVWFPKESSGPLPLILSRSPYGWDDSESDSFLDGPYKYLAEEQFIFVFQDIRGRFGSEGKFVMQRIRDDRSLGSIDESTDAYDTIDWLVKNVKNNNGRVGMLGISYGGWTTTMATIDPHPALRAVSEQASHADEFLGDDFHHNGAFRLSYGFEYAAAMESNNSKEVHPFAFGAYDVYEWYRRLGPLSNVDEKYFHGNVPTWSNFVNHPNYDLFWRKQAMVSYLRNLTVPNLNVAGWWDQEDFYGPLTIYESLERTDAKHLNYLVVGPWNHGGWALTDEGHWLGKFETNTTEYFLSQVEAPWFSYWLKDKGSLKQPEALIFQTGTNKWKSYDAWPPRHGIVKRRLYLREAGRLSFDRPTAAASSGESDQYVSDPQRPVPYRNLPIPPSFGEPGWRTWLISDQRFVYTRPDVLSWETDSLQSDISVAGDIVAHLFASTTGSDGDWIVKLIDVYPEDYPKDKTMGGYQLMIASDVVRARFRNSFEHPQPIPPGKVIQYTIDLHSNNHCFLKGHRIMVQVQSTWFPLIDRNPQKFVPNIFKASPQDFRKATQRVYRSVTFPSNVELPIEDTNK
jgi:uncharacterized protein